ncbi:MAG TPA: hypothetical protein PLJ40_05085 [Paludibacteraceae bacterium]|nr:hypothetical protein [Paludibacteraceae bacterium]HQB69681.1 hypothetical protein [Paludibacteraceae bacterium]HRS67857.1 hypothetical protein [Paludibacteraceae bacterium]
MNKLKLLVIASCLFVTVIGKAQERPSRVPAKRDPIEVMQPDSTFLTIYLRGDERYHVRMTADGYVIKQNKKGYYCYAKINCKGQLVPSCRVAKNPEDRSKCDWHYLKKLEKNKKLKLNP